MQMQCRPKKIFMYHTRSHGWKAVSVIQWSTLDTWHQLAGSKRKYENKEKDLIKRKKLKATQILTSLLKISPKIEPNPKKPFSSSSPLCVCVFFSDRPSSSVHYHG